MSYYAGSCDVAVIGAGHAGIEAALAAARLGNHTILFTINLTAFRRRRKNFRIIRKIKKSLLAFHHKRLVQMRNKTISHTFIVCSEYHTITTSKV